MYTLIDTSMVTIKVKDPTNAFVCPFCKGLGGKTKHVDDKKGYDSYGIMMWRFWSTQTRECVHCSGKGYYRKNCMKKKLTERQLKECIMSLREAKQLIVDGHLGFVCNAIERVQKNHDYAGNYEGYYMCAYLRVWVDEMIEDEPILESWIKRYNNGICPVYTKKTRIRWMEWMISTLEEELNNEKA